MATVPMLGIFLVSYTYIKQIFLLITNLVNTLSDRVQSDALIRT